MFAHGDRMFIWEQVVTLWVDRIARAGLALGVVMMLQPLWAQGFRYGFFVTALFTLMHIATSRLRADPFAGADSSGATPEAPEKGLKG